MQIRDTSLSFSGSLTLHLVKRVRAHCCQVSPIPNGPPLTAKNCSHVQMTLVEELNCPQVQRLSCPLKPWSRCQWGNNMAVQRGWGPGCPPRGSRTAWSPGGWREQQQAPCWDWMRAASPGRLLPAYAALSFHKRLLCIPLGEGHTTCAPEVHCPSAADVKNQK